MRYGLKPRAVVLEGDKDLIPCPRVIQFSALASVVLLPPPTMGEGWGEGLDVPAQGLEAPHPLPKGEGTAQVLME